MQISQPPLAPIVVHDIVNTTDPLKKISRESQSTFTRAAHSEELLLKLRQDESFGNRLGYLALTTCMGIGSLSLTTMDPPMMIKMGLTGFSLLTLLPACIYIAGAVTLAPHASIFLKKIVATPVRDNIFYVTRDAATTTPSLLQRLTATPVTTANTLHEVLKAPTRNIFIHQVRLDELIIWGSLRIFSSEDDKELQRSDLEKSDLKEKSFTVKALLNIDGQIYPVQKYFSDRQKALDFVNLQEQDLDILLSQRFNGTFGIEWAAPC